MRSSGWFNGFLLFVGLPLALFVLTFLVTGCYYETNDDQIITLLLRGVLIQPAQTDLVLYFHGLGHGLAWLYREWPAVPWYGLVLYLLLLVATSLAFYLVFRAFPHYKNRRWLLLMLFFCALWIEHVLWFNYVRVPVLLAGLALLLAWQTNREGAARQKWLLLLVFCMLIALCIRPTAAVLGFLVVAPVIVLGEREPGDRLWRLLWPVLLFLVLAAGIFLYRSLGQSPAAQQYQTLDFYKSTVLDYGIFRPHPQTSQDSLVFEGIGHWFLADKQVLNADFYQAKGSINLAYIMGEVAPAKLRVLLMTLVRDHFLVLWINLILVGWLLLQNPGRGKQLLAYQFYFWGLIILTGIFLKLPPRILTPCLSLYTLVHLTWSRKTGAWRFRRIYALAQYVLVLLVLVQVLKTGHRSYRQRLRQQENEQILLQVAARSAGRVLVTSALPDFFRSLSPFRNYAFGAKTIFSLTGWYTIAPGFDQFYFRLTGRENWSEALLVMSQKNKTVWLLEPDFYIFLQSYTRSFYGQELKLKPLNYLSGFEKAAAFYGPAAAEPRRIRAHGHGH